MNFFFRVVLNVDVDSVVSYETILHVLSKINVVDNKCILMYNLAQSIVSVVSIDFIFMSRFVKQRSQRSQ